MKSIGIGRFLYYSIVHDYIFCVRRCQSTITLTTQSLCIKSDPRSVLYNMSFGVTASLLRTDSARVKTQVYLGSRRNTRTLYTREDGSVVEVDPRSTGKETYTTLDGTDEKCNKEMKSPCATSVRDTKDDSDYFESIVRHDNIVAQPSNSIANTPHIDTVNENTLIEQRDQDDVIEPAKLEAKKVHNLAALVNKSVTLQELVKLGVDLSKVETVEGGGNLFVKLDFLRDVEPILLFLRDIGVDDDDLGACISRNPLMLGESPATLQPMVDYFRSKKFAADSLARIVTKVPQVLTMGVVTVDKTLGKCQKLFRLAGAEVRAVVTRLPKLLVWHPARVKDVRLYVAEFLGFSDVEQKRMLLACPKVYLSNKHQLGVRFDYLHNTMGVPHSLIVHWPAALRTRPHLLKQRHLYLTRLSRAQYDPTRDNYVSLQAFVTGRDRDFCDKVAKTPVAEMNEFLKTL